MAGNNAPTDAAKDVQHLVRTVKIAALATRDRGGEDPYVSLVTMAADPAGRPVFLLSNLARHTQNIREAATVSVLVGGMGSGGHRAAQAQTAAPVDPLAEDRATVIGTMQEADADAEARIRRRFLALHPAADMYVDFADFNWFQLIPKSAHLIGGFGRIIDVPGTELLVDCSDAADLLANEADIVAHMNEDHSDAVALMVAAARPRDGGSAGWVLTGLDPAGFDVSNGRDQRRVAFADRVTTADGARVAFVRLTQAARAAL